MRILDSHAHILPPRVRDNLAEITRSEKWFGLCHAGGRVVATAEDLVLAMDRDGVEATLCFTWPFASPELCREANDYVLSAARQFPGRILPGIVVQPLHPEAAAEVTRCAKQGAIGVGEMNADAQDFSVEDPAIAGVVATCGRLGMPFTLHCSEPVGHEYAGKGTLTPARLALFCQRYPDLTVIAAHLGGGLPLFAAMPEVQEICQRLYFDTAAVPFLYRPLVYRQVIELIGMDRILLGTDYPLLQLPRYLQALEDAGLSAQEKSAIAAGNLAHLLRL